MEGIVYDSPLTHHDINSTQSPEMFYNICLIVATIIAKRLCFVNHGKAINKNNRGRIEEILSKGSRQNDIFRVIMALWI